MLVDWGKLKKLPVYTHGGLYLGKVNGFEMDAESHIIRAYFVRKNIIEPVLSISREQVISITAEKLTVEDAFVRDPVPYASATPSNS